MRTSTKKRGQRSTFRERLATSCPPGYVTSARLREILGIDLTRFRSLARLGKINASRHNESGYALYEQSYVEELLSKKADGSLFESVNQPYTREESARVFELLEQNMPHHLIVIETRLLPQVLKRIVAEYNDLKNTISINGAVLDQINQLRAYLMGPFPPRTASDIYLILKASAEDRTCPHCDAASAELCATCLRERFSSQANGGMTNGASGKIDRGEEPLAQKPPLV
jgi:hypothetical protein